MVSGAWCFLISQAKRRVYVPHFVSTSNPWDFSKCKKVCTSIRFRAVNRCSFYAKSTRSRIRSSLPSSMCWRTMRIYGGFSTYETYTIPHHSTNQSRCETGTHSSDQTIRAYASLFVYYHLSLSPIGENDK